MRRAIFGFDWRRFEAHLLLLSRFLKPRASHDFCQSAVWKNVLREEPQRAITRFCREGLLVEADVAARLSYKFRVADLKPMLRERGLRVSGRKAELIKRLLQADSAGMERAVEGLALLCCSLWGRQSAEALVTAEKAKRDRCERQVLEHLRLRDFKAAVQTMAQFEANQVFSRGIGIDWKRYNPTRDIEMLDFIFTRRPKILRRLRADALEALRIGAGMMTLWGTNTAKKWLPPDLNTGLAFDNVTAARMFSFLARHEARLRQYRHSAVVKSVEILAAPDSCSACRELSGRRYTMDRAPELPYEHCTSEKGCRCVALAITYSYRELGIPVDEP